MALAAEARRRGAEVTLIAANVSLERPEGVRCLDVESAAELEAVTRSEFEHADVLLMAAAVSDFRPVQAQRGKIKKEGRDALAIELEPTRDVLQGISEIRRPGQTLIGFAAEHGEGGLAHARAKLARKGLDAVVLNDVSRPGIGFDSTDNEVTILTADGRESMVPRRPKAEVAAAVLDCVQAVRAEKVELQP